MVLSGGEELGDIVESHAWKSIDEDDGSTQRMTVPGGHLYRTIVTTNGGNTSVAMVFVPAMKKPRRRSSFVLRKTKRPRRLT